ncbi:DUF1643 domain-containing protein [Methylovorus glucosotrophus]|uniref:DUF1643 domain-containing protein n=1 Tax=Methylovorus glucosotrophus (strain SIP3-4) TaxID=582744 RepID=C6XED7_METGS|nr:DUF1643 domain-containing protein [Methylovorus glucosotrophus]ACT50912.1 protein of unknown function DUF1643 [Methylovorus glucosotrophus SIP3-4]
MSAIISDCKQYRYQLQRGPQAEFPTRAPALFIMLNPSTADAEIDDPTIRRCRSFANAWDCDGIVVANLYALRATNPKELWLHPDPVGPDNDAYLRELAKHHETIVCAWGAKARPDRVEAVREIFSGRLHRLMCLGVTKKGAPRHPLYIRRDQQLVEWKP